MDQLGRWLRRHQGIERNPIYRLASDVSSGRITPQRAYEEIERHSLLNRLADGDLWALDREAARAAVDDPQRALILSRLTILAARYKGFDRVLVECNLRSAEMLNELGETRDQELHLREALHAAERIANVPGERRALSRLARIAYENDDTDRARELLSRQLDAGREDADTLEDVETALLLGDLARSAGNATQAREYYHRAGRSAKRVGHFAGVVDALLRQVVVLREIHDIDAAMLLLQQAQEAAERTIDTRLQIEIAIQSAALMAEKGQLNQARNQLVTAVERARSMADVAMESRGLTGLAQVDLQAGKMREAAAHYRELADLEQQLGNRTPAVQALVEAAEALMSLRDSEGAIRLLQTALEITEGLNDSKLRQRVLGLRGLALGALNQRSEALESLSRALSESRQSEDKAGEGRWLVALGELLLQFGEVSDAQIAARRALELSAELKDRQLEAQGDALAGAIFMSRGQHREAEEALQRALQLARERDNADDQLYYLQILAQLGNASGEASVATKYLRQALDVATLYGRNETRARLHGRLARIYQATNHLPSSEEHFRAAASAAEEAGSELLLARSLRGLANVQDMAGNVGGAIDSYERAIEVTENLRDLKSAAALHCNLGYLLSDRDIPSEARRHLNLAVEYAMAAGEYKIADTAREMLHWLNSTDGETRREPSDDLLLGEMAVSDDSSSFRQATGD